MVFLTGRYRSARHTLQLPSPRARDRSKSARASLVGAVQWHRRAIRAQPACIPIAYSLYPSPALSRPGLREVRRSTAQPAPLEQFPSFASTLSIIKPTENRINPLLKHLNVPSTGKIPLMQAYADNPARQATRTRSDRILLR